MAHAVPTNNYGPAKLIVATSAANGTHTTLASAMAAATSGDTVVLRDSVTEDVTLTPGVNITAWGSESSLNGTGSVSITGTLTMTGAGTCSIYGIQLQTNGAAFLAVTGSVSSVVNLENCYLNCTDATGITFSSSSASSGINISNCTGNIADTGITLFISSSEGTIHKSYSYITNSGLTTTASTISAGGITIFSCELTFPITTSGTSGFGLIDSTIITSSNTTAVTIGGSSNGTILRSSLSSGTSSAISISSTLFLSESTINSQNANVITGAGTLRLGSFTQLNALPTQSYNPTTITAEHFNYGIARSQSQPAFFAYKSATTSNVTGDGTQYQIICNTESLDQNSNYDNATGVFTADMAGNYYFDTSVTFGSIGAAHTLGVARIIAGGITYDLNTANTANLATSVSSCTFDATLGPIPLAAGDTVALYGQVNNSTKTVSIIGNATRATCFSGFLMS